MTNTGRATCFIVALACSLIHSAVWADDARRLYQRAGTELQQGQQAAAVQSLQKALDLFPKYAEAHHLLGVTFATMDRFDEAKAELKTAVELHPNFARAFLDLGMLSMRAKDWPAAEQSLTAALFVYPRFEEAQLALAQVHWALGDTASAVKEYQGVLERNPAHEAALYELAVLQKDEGRAQEAQELMTRLVKNNPAHQQGWLLLAQIAGRNQDLPLAVDAYEHLVRIQGTPEAHFHLATLYQAQGQLSQAVDHFEAVRQLDPRNAEAHLNLGVSYAALHRLDDGEHEYLEALRLDPSLVEAHYNLGVFYEFERKDASRALTHYRQYAALGGTDARIQRLLGHITSKE